jgi:hypothetical protein
MKDHRRWGLLVFENLSFSLVPNIPRSKKGETGQTPMLLHRAPPRMNMLDIPRVKIKEM